MREHLIACFEQRKITTFPLYEKRNTEKVVTYKETSSPWNMPRRSARLQSKTTQNLTNKSKLSNRFETKGADLQKKNLNKSIKITSKAARNKMKTTDTICNISSTKLRESEISLLNKGLNFCPSTKEPNKEQLLEDLYVFCRKLKLKEYFHSGDSSTDKIQHEETCDLNTKLPNCYFNPNNETPLNLQRYISIVKKEITELLKKPNYQQSNLTSDERLKLRHLSENRNLTIKGSDKGGKIAIMDTADYIEHCELLLNDREFYEKFDANPTLIYIEEIEQKIYMLKKNYITKQAYNYLAENLENPRTPFFYRVLKIHKIFDSFPPLPPIISGFNSCTYMHSLKIC